MAAPVKIKVRFLKSPTQAPFYLAYNANEIAMIEKDLALKMIDAGIAEKIISKKAK